MAENCELTYFKVVTEDLRSVGLLRASRLQYKIGEWVYSLEPLSDHYRKGGGLWVYSKRSDAFNGKRYIEKKHGIKCLIFSCRIGVLLTHTPKTFHRVKTDKVMLLEEVKKTRMPKDCLFCDKDNHLKHRLILENESFYARWDNYPINVGHAEVVPKRHIESFFDMTEEEIRQMFDLLKKVKCLIDAEYHPDGYNVGLNDGEAAGRTIHHLHIHIIPRYKGDVPNPRGGIRNIIPDKGDYTTKNQ